MNLLGAKLYDPTTAVGLGTAASAMAVFDVTNARITFVVPPSGMVRVVIQCVIHGATTFTQILLGVMEGAAVKGKVAPVGSMNGTALATTLMTQTADFVVTGLVAGATLVWDAAWGIETFVASSLIKYGGPANATANNDFGALVFQIWDPCPIYTPTSATAPTTTVQDKLVTEKTAVDAIKVTTDKFVFTGANKVDASVRDWVGDTIPARNVAGVPLVDLKYTLGTLSPATAGSVRADAVTGAVGSVTGAVGSVTGAVGSVTGAVGSVTGAVGSVTAGVTLAASAVTAIWDKLTSALTTVGSIGKLLVDNIDAAISSRLATSGYTAPPTAAQIRTEMDSNSVGMAAIYTRIGAPAGLTIAADVAAVKVDTAAVKVQTDKLVFTVANKLDVNVLVINGITLIGDGTVTPMHG